MSGDTRELEEGFKVEGNTIIPLTENAVDELLRTKRISIDTKEKYEITRFGKHQLVLQTWVKETATGKSVMAGETKITLPKNVPKYLTRHDLWHHTEEELSDLRQLIKQNKEKKPSRKTLKQWQELITFKKKARNNVFQTDHVKEPEKDTVKSEND